MRDEINDREVEQALSLWVDQMAPTSPPDRLLEATFVRTMGTGQLRVYPWHRLMPRKRELSYSGSGVGFGIALLVLMVVLAMAAGFVGGAFRPMPTPSPNPTAEPALPSAISVPVEATIEVDDPIAMVSDGELLWVRALGGRVDRIDPATEAVTDSAKFGSGTDLFSGLALNADGLWTSSADDSMVYRIDRQTLALDASIVAGLGPRGVLANADGVWVADRNGGNLLRIDPLTNQVSATIELGLDVTGGPSWLAEGLGSIWVDTPRTRTIDRVDPVSNAIQATIQVMLPTEFTPCGGMAIANDSAWITSCSTGNQLGRVDATTNSLTDTIDMYGHGYNPALINGSVWISVDGGTADTGKLVRIDPTTNAIDRVLVPSTPFGGGGDIVVAAGSVWVVDDYHDAVVGLPMAAFEP